MKNLKERTLALLKTGHCTPQISRLAKDLNVPAATIHYNVKSLEDSGVVRGYRAIIDHKKAGDSFSCFILVNLEASEYSDPEKVGRALSGYPEVEMVDIVTGDWEIVLKVRTKGIDDYYSFVKRVLSRKGILRTKTISSLKELKSGFSENRQGD